MTARSAGPHLQRQSMFALQRRRSGGKLRSHTGNEDNTEINGICASAVDQKKPHYFASTYSSPYNQCQEVARCGFNNRSEHQAQNAMSNHAPPNLPCTRQHPHNAAVCGELVPSGLVVFNSSGSAFTPQMVQPQPASSISDPEPQNEAHVAPLVTSHGSNAAMDHRFLRTFNFWGCHSSSLF